MHITHHASQRMNQRGISRRILDFTLRHGRVEGDKHIVDRKESQRIIERLNEELRVAKQILDKGGARTRAYLPHQWPSCWWTLYSVRVFHLSHPFL